MLFDRSELVAQTMIYGNSLKSTLVAIIVPDELVAASWAKSKGISESFEELCKRDDLKEEIMKQVRQAFCLDSISCTLHLLYVLFLLQIFRLAIYVQLSKFLTVALGNEFQRVSVTSVLNNILVSSLNHLLY